MLKGIEKEATYFYHPDHLGSVSVVSNHKGEPYERVEYLPFGEVWIEENDPATSYIPFRFTSKELDKETGLYYYGARYYEPKLSRWMSADPAGFALMNPGSDIFSLIGGLNPYSFVSNNPVRYVDPTGLFEETTSENQELAEKYDSMKIVNINKDQINPDDRHDVYIYYNEGDYEDTLHVNRRTLQEGALKARTKMKNSETSHNTYTAKNALADIADLAESMNMSSNDMVNSLSLVLAAVSGSKAEENDIYSVGFAFLDSGFKPEYQDGSNQVRHFTGYLLGGFYWGNTVKMTGRYRGDDSVDQALGDAGIQAGTSILSEGQFSDFSLGNWIRSNL